MTTFQPKMADLSGYPIIRIDQISLVASAVLSKAEPEVLDLMASLNAEEGPKPPLLYYLQRQLDAMRKELAERSAYERIESILKGTHLVDEPTSMTRLYSSSSSSEMPREISNQQFNDIPRALSVPSSSSGMTSPPMIPAIPTTNVPAVAYKRIPLPSELARQNSHTIQNTSERTIPSSANHIETPRNRTTSSSRDDEEEEESMSSEGGTSRITSASSHGRSYDNTEPLSHQEDQPSTSEKKRPPRRSTSLRNNTASAVVDTNNSPSKKPKIVRPFGSEFSVAATEKRIRFYPKKEIKETIEEIRAKDRLERRKAAMKRLMSRREEQQALAAELKLKRKQQKLLLQKQNQLTPVADGTATTSAEKEGEQTHEPAISSDDSETVSGDDSDGVDDLSVSIDPLLVQQVEKAVEQAVAEAEVEKVYEPSINSSSLTNRNVDQSLSRTRSVKSNGSLSVQPLTSTTTSTGRSVKPSAVTVKNDVSTNSRINATKGTGQNNGIPVTTNKEIKQQKTLSTRQNRDDGRSPSVSTTNVSSSSAGSSSTRHGRSSSTVTTKRTKENTSSTTTSNIIECSVSQEHDDPPMSLDEPSIQFELLPEGVDLFAPKDNDEELRDELHEFHDTSTQGVGERSLSRGMERNRQKIADTINADGNMVEPDDDDDDDDDDDVLDLFAHNNNPESKVLLRNHTKIRQLLNSDERISDETDKVETKGSKQDIEEEKDTLSDQNHHHETKEKMVKETGDGFSDDDDVMFAHVIPEQPLHVEDHVDGMSMKTVENNRNTISHAMQVSIHESHEIHDNDGLLPGLHVMQLTTHVQQKNDAALATLRLMRQKKQQPTILTVNNTEMQDATPLFVEDLSKSGASEDKNCGRYDDTQVSNERRAVEVDDGDNSKDSDDEQEEEDEQTKDDVNAVVHFDRRKELSDGRDEIIDVIANASINEEEKQRKEGEVGDMAVRGSTEGHLDSDDGDDDDDNDDDDEGIQAMVSSRSIITSATSTQSALSVSPPIASSMGLTSPFGPPIKTKWNTDVGETTSVGNDIEEDEANGDEDSDDGDDDDDAVLPTYHNPARQQQLPSQQQSHHQPQPSSQQSQSPQPSSHQPSLREEEDDDDFEIEQTPRNDSIQDDINTTMMKPRSSDNQNHHIHEGWHQPSTEMGLSLSTSNTVPPPPIGIAEASSKDVLGSSSGVGGTTSGMRPPLPAAGKSRTNIHHTNGSVSTPLGVTTTTTSTPSHSHTNIATKSGNGSMMLSSSRRVNSTGGGHPTKGGGSKGGSLRSSNSIANSDPSSSTIITNNNETTTKTARKLTDFYPHLGMIFPIAYSATSNKQADGFTARALIESLQFQAKLYQEWMEVMGDYATVFSQDRGLSSEGGDGGTHPSSAVYEGGSRTLHFRVKSSRPEVYNIVTDVFQASLKHWNELPSGLGLGLSWNLLWTWSKPHLNMTHLLIWQRVNHFEDSKQLTRKDLLKKNLQRYTDMSGKASGAFEIMPQTFLLPHEFTQFVGAFMDIETKKEQNQLQNFWIMKPVGLSRGRGISLVRDVASLTYSQTSVVQRYVEDPLCLDGYKFDLRLYVLVTSFRPLEAFIYGDGFARVSTHTYSMDPNQMENKFVHLTNSSIQKLNTEGPSSDNPLMNCAEDSGGSKISLKGAHGLWQRLEKQGIDVPILWKNICGVVMKSLVVVDDKMTHQPCCFEVFGYDVLIDSALRPWLIEINASPSMARENALDVRVKNAMIADTIRLIDPMPFDRAAVASVLRKRFADIMKGRFTLMKNDPEWEKDLQSILGDHVPRQYGELPTYMGDYQRLCPETKLYERVLKMKARIIKSD